MAVAFQRGSISDLLHFFFLPVPRSLFFTFQSVLTSGAERAFYGLGLWASRNGAVFRLPVLLEILLLDFPSFVGWSGSKSARHITVKFIVKS